MRKFGKGNLLLIRHSRESGNPEGFALRFIILDPRSARAAALVVGDDGVILD
jgi:hypothetical protein